MPPSILNLDELKVTRTVVLNGTERLLRSMTVEQFVAADEFEDKFKAATGKAQAALMIAKIREFMDDTTEAELLKLDMTQLMALLAFIRGADLKANPTSAAASEATKAGAAGKRKPGAR